MEAQTETNHICPMLTHLSVCMLATANNSHLVTLTKDEYVGIGSYRVIRRGVIQLSLSEHFLKKSALGVVNAEKLDGICQQSPEPSRQCFHLWKRKHHPSTFPTRSPHVQKKFIRAIPIHCKKWSRLWKDGKWIRFGSSLHSARDPQVSKLIQTLKTQNGPLSLLFMTRWSLFYIVAEVCRTY